MFKLKGIAHKNKTKQVFSIRRLVGESVLDRNEGLWREIDALEDILKDAQVIVRVLHLAIKPVRSIDTPWIHSCIPQINGQAVAFAINRSSVRFESRVLRVPAARLLLRRSFSRFFAARDY